MNANSPVTEAPVQTYLRDPSKPTLALPANACGIDPDEFYLS